MPSHSPRTALVHRPRLTLRLIQEHLNRWMLAYVALAMAAGLAIGYPPASVTSRASTIGGLTTVAVFLSSTR